MGVFTVYSSSRKLVSVSSTPSCAERALSNYSFAYERESSTVDFSTSFQESWCLASREPFDRTGPEWIWLSFVSYYSFTVSSVGFLYPIK